MKNLKLKGSLEIPILGFGTWQLEPEDCYQSVSDALEIGYRHIDTAKVYDNETEVGKAINDSNIDRGEIFLTTKLWRDYLKKDQVRKECEDSLSRLNQDYIDLYLIHWPNKDVPIQETFEALKEVQEEGLIKSFGVSNFTINHLKDALETGIEFVNNQVEFHPTLYQKELLDFCKTNNIVLTAYCPIGQGADLQLDVVQKLAQKYNSSPAQVVLNWIMAKDVVAIPRSTKKEHIQDNFDSTTWELAAEDVAKIDEVSQENRICIPGFNEFDY